ncbi:MAG: hypothetical protein JO276_14645 [Sphingomonadaceae bacterium]|nr:hypothetical protein [Sphingomonadaceae bacterium]
MAGAGRIVIAGLAVTLCTAAYQDRAERTAAVHRDGAEFAQRIRGGRRICAVDRLAESRLPRTTCMTEREWRDRQVRGLRRE